MKASVTVEGDVVLVDVPGPNSAAFSLPRADARELAQALLHAAGLLLTPEALATWTDEQVANAWKCSSWEVGDTSADALAAEMERRGLDF
jgi:hypothetical protein